MRRKRELRIMPLSIELRAGEGEEAGKLVGHAAVFNEWTTIADSWAGAMYEEQVAPGAFRKAIKEQDIRALWNHDPNIVLGRTKAETLVLREDETGLAATITPPDNEWGRPVLDAVRRGDVSGMSIAFQVTKEMWTKPDLKVEPNALRKRVIQEAKLFEVSPVTFPAYPQTDIGARGQDPGDEDESRLLRAFRAGRLAEMGLPLLAEERAEVRTAVEFLIRVSEEPGPVGQAQAQVGQAQGQPLQGDHSSQAQGGEPGPVERTQGQSLQGDHSEAARARKLQLMKMAMEVRR